MSESISTDTPWTFDAKSSQWSCVRDGTVLCVGIVQGRDDTVMRVEVTRAARTEVATAWYTPKAWMSVADAQARAERLAAAFVAPAPAATHADAAQARTAVGEAAGAAAEVTAPPVAPSPPPRTTRRVAPEPVVIPKVTP